MKFTIYNSHFEETKPFALIISGGDLIKNPIKYQANHKIPFLPFQASEIKCFRSEVELFRYINEKSHQNHTL